MGNVSYRRKGSTHSAPVTLPDGYRKLAYIQSSGTQYIDTGFKPNQDTGFVLDFQALSTNTGNNHHFATANSSNPALYFAHRLKADRSGFASRYGTGALKDVAAGAPFERHTLTRNKNKVSIDGGAETTETYRAFQVPCNLYLFASNQANTAGAYTVLKVYSCKIYDSGTLIRDFIPCVSPSGAVGLYDLVGKKFYGNAGTGAFIGSEVP